MNTDLIVLLIMLVIALITLIVTMYFHLKDDAEACEICPHIGLMICHSCSHEDRERIIRLYKNGGVIL